jgi:transposase InsO family protein
MSPHPLSEEARTEIALFRYTLIIPIVRERSPQARHQLRKNLAMVGHKIPHSSRRTVSLRSLFRWEQAYRQGGFEALKPRRRADKGQLRALSPATLDRAEALKREQPHRSARSIAAMLTLDQADPVPETRLAPRTLRRHLAARGATAPRLLQQQRPQPYRRFERPAFGQLWQGDALHGPRLPDPAQPDQLRQVFLFAFIDDHTRLVTHARFYWNEQLPRMEDCFKRAILRYGIPQAVYVDRGKVYTAKQFDTLCATLGIQRILASPYYPEGKGKIERFFGFVRSDFLPELEQSPPGSLAELNQSLLAWLEVVYHPKHHAETGQSPLERFRQQPDPAIRPADPATLQQAFLHRDQRKVTTTATISFMGNRYQVPAFLRGQTLEIRYDPFDLARLELWFQDTFLQLAQPERLVATHHPQVTPDPVPAPPPKTGLDYLALLRTEHQRLIQAQLDGLHFSQLTTKSTQETDDDPLE